MAQPKVNLASALANLYISRGGNPKDLRDSMDSADIVAMLYHQLGGNQATPKGMPMAELVALLSTTQGGGGGGVEKSITVENRLNEQTIEYEANILHHIENGVVTGLRLGNGSWFFVAMEQDADSQYPPTFFLKSGATIPTSYSAEDGGYLGETTADMSVGGSEVIEVIFDRPQA